VENQPFITPGTEQKTPPAGFIGRNIRVGTGLIRALYIFVGDTIVSTPQDATPASADAQTSQHENP